MWDSYPCVSSSELGLVLPCMILAKPPCQLFAQQASYGSCNTGASGIFAGSKNQYWCFVAGFETSLSLCTRLVRMIRSDTRGLSPASAPHTCAAGPYSYSGYTTYSRHPVQITTLTMGGALPCFLLLSANFEFPLFCLLLLSYSMCANCTSRRLPHICTGTMYWTCHSSRRATCVQPHHF